MNIVLVHGFLNRGGILRGLKAHLTSLGHTCYAPSLRPCDARSGLAVLGEQLADYIEGALPQDSRIALIGFSMGAIVSRYYLQKLGGHRKVDAFFSIGGPHAGTISAYAYPGAGVYEMRPGSAFLAQLERSADCLADLPLTCYWTPFDLMIRPLASARWARAEHVRIPALVHSFMVFDRRLYRDIARRLAVLESKGALEPA